MTVLTWTDDRVEQLKKLWESGLSASQIAAELGNVTRNAVIGKVHRLGFPAAPRAPPRGAASAQGPPAQHMMRFRARSRVATRRWPTLSKSRWNRIRSPTTMWCR